MKPHRSDILHRRIIHEVVRRHLLRSDEGAIEHLTLDEVAAFVGGSTFDTESARIENHLLSCKPCRDSVKRLHEEYEAGVVPNFVQQTSEFKVVSAAAEVTSRRWTPWFLAALVFGALVGVPLSFKHLFRGGDTATERDYWVVSRVGTPVVSGEGMGRNVAIRAAMWIPAGASLVFDSGDALLVIDRDGRMRRLSRGKDEVEREAEPLLERLIGEIAATRKEIDRAKRSEESTSTLPSNKPTVLYPRGLILENCPTVRWSDVGGAKSYDVRLVSKDDGETRYRATVSDQRYRFPRQVRPLEPGREFSISIGAEPRLFPEPTTEVFKTADAATTQRLTAELETLDRLAGRRSELLRGEYLRQAGFHADAMLEFEAMLRDEIDNVEVMARLKWVYTRCGLDVEAANMGKLISKR